MPDAADSTPPGSQLWSRKRIAALFIGVPALLLISVFALILRHDADLEPYDDLLPTITTAPGAEENGYALLLRKWNSPSPIVQSHDTARRWRGVREGSLPWEDTIAGELNPEHRDFLAPLQEALALPVWICPVPDSRVSNPDDASYSWTDYFLGALMAETGKSARAGNCKPAVDLIVQIRQMTRRQIAGSGYFSPLSRGITWERANGEFTCLIVSGGGLSADDLTRLAEVWADDVITKANLRQAACGDCAMFREHIRWMANPKETSGANWWQRFFVKPNQCINLHHTEVRRMLEHCLETGLTRHLEAGVDSPSRISPNAAGLRQTAWSVRAADYELSDYPRSILFRSRALKVWLAVQRWRLQHSGELPPKLEALVPAFLPEIPADPWDGKPLRLHPTDPWIMGVGADWIDQPVWFTGTTRGWFGNNADAPAMRLTMPPPSSLPPAPSAGSAKGSPHKSSAP